MNLADSKEAINKVCERFHRAYDEILGCLTKHIFENEDTAYNNICRGIRLLIYHRSKNATDGLRIKDEAFDVMIENNLPAPLKECWVENNLYDFEYYIANIFWPKVIDKFLRMPSVEIAQDMIKDETAWDVIIDKAEKSLNVGNDLQQEICNALIGQTVMTRYKNEFHKIASVDFRHNPTELVRVSILESKS